MRRLVLLLAVASAASGCSVTGVAYRQDDRVSFTTPDDRDTVTLPLTIRWEYEDFEVGPRAGSFGVFVNHAPQPPGKTFAWFGEDDTRDMYTTTEPTITIEQVPPRTDDRREQHEVTVVLLDEDGKRVAETAWAIEFEVERDR